MIPVLITPCISRFDLLDRMLDSVDVPVGRIVVVNNDPASDWDRHGVHVLRPLINVGYGGGINLVIRQTPDAPWWLYCNADLVWGAGDLAAIAERMQAARGPRVVTGDRHDARLLRGAYGALNRETVEAVGLFDEDTFFPAYYEDDDYEYRCHQGGVEWLEYNGSIGHDRSASIHSSPELAQANSRTFPENQRAYIAKWGGPPGSETYSRPWNKPVPLSYAPVDIAGRARRSWT